MLKRIWAGFLIPMVLMLPPWRGTAAAEAARAPSAQSLVITYHTRPSARLAFRSELARSTVPLLRKMQADGSLKDYLVLNSRHADAGGWDAMVVLTFASEAAASDWKQVEQRTPAALVPRALAQVDNIDSVPADLTRSGPGQPPGDQSVFLVIPYVYLVPVGEYVEYLDSYVLPQLRGWMAEKALDNFSLYLASFPAGRPWQSLLLLEYHDRHAISQRDAVVAKVRARLAADPVWKAVSDGKKNVRSEGMAVLADVLARSR